MKRIMKARVGTGMKNCHNDFALTGRPCNISFDIKQQIYIHVSVDNLSMEVCLQPSYI